MKLRKIVFASALLATFGCVYAADNAKQTRKRVDAPWVSLAHQRALSGGSVEKSSAEVTKKNKKSILDGFFTEDSAPELSADKFNYAQGDKNMLRYNQRLWTLPAEKADPFVAYAICGGVFIVYIDGIKRRNF